MASHRKMKRIVRGALAVTTVIATVTVSPATADTPSPTPPPSNDPVAQFNQLSEQANTLNEQINAANVDLTNKQALAAKASGDVAAAKAAEAVAQAQEDKYLVQVDKFTDASFEGARFNQLSALLTGTSARDYLNRAGDLQDVATDDFDTLSKFQAAIDAARTAQSRASKDQATAQAAADAANALLQQLNQQNAQLATQMLQVNKALHNLSATQQSALNSDIGPQGAYVAPAGVAGAAMQMALNQRGKPYQFGGAGPADFDCSGLVDYAYALAGMPGLPHSAAALQGMGVAVPQADMQAGDLVFFGDPAYHVGIYVGNGLMVDAPTSGQVVKVQPIFSGFSGARRLGQ